MTDKIRYYLKCQTVCYCCRRILKEFEGPCRTIIWDLCDGCWRDFEIKGALPNLPVVREKEESNGK